jgi:hypothetical protein
MTRMHTLYHDIFLHGRLKSNRVTKLFNRTIGNNKPLYNTNNNITGFFSVLLYKFDLNWFAVKCCAMFHTRIETHMLNLYHVL